jgi:hypothetical protein
MQTVITFVTETQTTWNSFGASSQSRGVGSILFGTFNDDMAVLKAAHRQFHASAVTAEQEEGE